MERIAISTDTGQVSMHFGRCPTFTIVDIEDGNIIKKQEVANPGHEVGFLPKFMQEQNVNCMIAGGMGPRALQLFAEKNIETVIGVSGNIDEVISAYLANKLTAGDSSCSQGSGKGYGLDKTGGCEHHHQEHHHGGQK